MLWRCAERRPRSGDLTSATVLPGLIDAHLHLASVVGAALGEVDLVHAASFEQVVARTRAFARTSTGPWVMGEGWDQNLWPGKAFPTHHALTAAIPDRPVVLARIDGQAILANAAAMKIARVARAAPDTQPAGHPALPDARHHSSMQTTHQISDMPWAPARLGSDRLKGAYAWRSLLDTGVHHRER